MQKPRLEVMAESDPENFKILRHLWRRENMLKFGATVQMKVTQIVEHYRLNFV